jgi:lipopolysaccharide cholinephosphotransferase
MTGQDGQARTPEELRKLQLVLLDMLIELDRICRKHDIKYSLIGGTLLGAVRHGGFIPWDDDVDVGMLRADYIRFREVCYTELNHDKYFFQDNTTDPHYRWGYGKLRRKNSEFLRAGQEHMKMRTGIFIDVFPADAVPDFYPLRVLHGFYCFVLRKILYSEVGRLREKSPFLRTWYKILYKIPAPFAFHKLERLAALCNKKPKKIVRNYTFPTNGGRFGHSSSYYEDIADIPFEGQTFMSFRDYKGYLSYKYGDYMALPPPEKRKWHPASVLRLPE